MSFAEVNYPGDYICYLLDYTGEKNRDSRHGSLCLATIKTDETDKSQTRSTNVHRDKDDADPKRRRDIVIVHRSRIRAACTCVRAGVTKLLHTRDEYLTRKIGFSVAK
ncbi:hypothetical protein GWI33_001272 [Rhynchophorus ferrugineus]|uniref:Uncharacterized protein n=1 Tax=Rhynchophorus ferrugineus TaxID=354439 RepID=A0A834IZ81_RHYFE|nr:hypothetical protein GWI33_001272 [Rhynchophorus ferrugineus]